MHCEQAGADYLITGGADCDKQNRIGWSPLHLAVLGMHHNLMEKLCIAGWPHQLERFQFQLLHSFVFPSLTRPVHKICIKPGTNAGMANPMLRCSKTTEVNMVIGIDRHVIFSAVKGKSSLAASQHYSCIVLLALALASCRKEEPSGLTS